MAFTKKVARHDKITIEGVDYSNAFNEFGFASSHTEEDVSGFSESGNDETQPGRTSQSFAGTMFYTEEVAAAIGPLHFERTIVTLVWQPDGLVNPSAIRYQAEVTINEFSPTNRRGSPSTFPFRASTADEDGIRQLGT